jgi:2-C-methyl-D-erythritol 4-phosphate cytidylyltransferase
MELDSRDLTQEHSNSDDSEVNVVILAGGSGERMGNGLPKQFYDLGNGERVLDLVLQSYESIREVTGIALVYNKDYKDIFDKICSKYHKIIRLVEGGLTRQDSVYRGIKETESKYVLIHDSARPLVCKRAVLECIKKLRSGRRAVHTAFSVYATMIVVKNNQILSTIDRSEIAYPQCPLGFSKEDLTKSFMHAISMAKEFQDEISLVRYADPDFEVDVVEGHQSGFKITYPEDFYFLKTYLCLKRNEVGKVKTNNKRRPK